MGDLELLAALLAATGTAHSPRALVRAIATTLAEQVPIVRVELGTPPVIAVLHDGDWICDDVVRSADAREIAPNLAVVTTGPLPAMFERAEFREALGQVIAAAARQVDVIRRVAQVSRRAHVEARELRADLDRREQAGELVARSAVMRAALTRVELVARHPTTVLIAGETGAGKEVFAREIHRRSPRAHHPLIQLDCGAIPATLIESELFGHERGAFTGADRAHAGAFERAHRGTLVLDEVGELPLAAQAKLLRVLQERRIRRIGGESELEVDVRLIAATNRRLATMVEQGTFREDLYYRLDVFAIEVPPLRERRADLGPLVAAITRQLARTLDVPIPPITRTLLARLEAHDWPGNVRELVNTLETAMILGGDDGLALPAEFPRRTKRGEAPPQLEAAIRTTIEDALRAARGKIYGRGGAAERLGLPPGTLQSKMKRLGIERTRFVA